MRPARHALLGRQIPIVFAVLVGSAVVACGGAVAPSPNATAPTPRPTPTEVPGAGGIDPGGGGSGGGSGGNAGGGVVVPVIPPIGPGVPDPFDGEPQLVTPQAGQQNPHPMNVGRIRASAGDDGKVEVELRWYSGVAPCNNLDSVTVARDEAARTIRLTVIEGNGPGDVACIEIAVLKATIVDLGVLGSGTWTISAEGEAKPIELTVD